MQTFETAAVISLIDHLSGPLKQLVSKVNKELGGLGGGNAPATDKMSKHHQMLAEAAEKHRRAVERVKDAYKDLALLATMHGLEKVHERAIRALEAGKELQHRETLMQGAGMSPSEVAAARARVTEGLKKAPNVSLEQGLELWTEMRSVLQDVHEVPKVIDTMIRAKGVLNHMDPTGGMSQSLGMLAKGAELLGYGNDPEKFQRYINASVKAMQFMGKTIDAKQIYDIAKYQRASGFALDEKYQFGVAMSLAQELKGSTFGKATDQYIKLLNSGFAGNNHAALKEWASIGMIKPGDIIYTKAGEAKGMKPNTHVKGSLESQNNPYEVFRHLYAPAIEAEVKKHLPTDPEKVRDSIKKELAKGDLAHDEELHRGIDRASPLTLGVLEKLRRLYPNAGAADLATKFYTQQGSIDRHIEGMNQALGLQVDLTKDATAALQGFSTAVTNAGAALTDKLMPKFAEALNPVSEWLANKAKEWGEYFQKHPNQGAAAGAGVVGVGVAAGLGGTYAMFEFAKRLLSAGGLDKAAVELTIAAKALDAAAAKLGTAGAAQGAAAGAAQGAAAGAGGAAAAGAAVAGGTGALPAAAIGAGVLASIAAAAGVAGSVMDKKAGDDPGHRKWTWGRIWHNFSSGHDSLPTKAEGDAALEKMVHQTAMKKLARILQHPEKHEQIQSPVWLPAAKASINDPALNPPAKHFTPQAADAKQNFGPLIAEVAKINSKPVDVSVKGDVKGEAKLGVSITPSPLFIAKMDEVKNIALQGQVANQGKNMAGPTGVTK